MYSPNVCDDCTVTCDECTVTPIAAVSCPPIIPVRREVKCLLEYANTKHRYISGGGGLPRSRQTTTSTSVNQMFALIMFLTNTHSNTVDKTSSIRLFLLCFDVYDHGSDISRSAELKAASCSAGFSVECLEFNSSMFSSNS